MSEIKIKVSKETSEKIEKEKLISQEDLTSIIEKEIDKKSIKSRLELVKIITRTKASVFNWDDLEKEIFKGALK